MRGEQMQPMRVDSSSEKLGCDGGGGGTEVGC